MPYVSKSEREAASQMTWTELLAHVQNVERCSEGEARRQIGNAIAERMLSVRWADQRKDFGAPSPNQSPCDEPSQGASHWQECKTDSNDPDLVLEPPPYDRELVDKRTAARLDKERHFRKPMFPRDQALLHWPEAHASAKAGKETQAIAFLKERLKADKHLRRQDAFKMCHGHFSKLSERRFRSHVWPQAREAAGLERTARAGRKPKRK